MAQELILPEAEYGMHKLAGTLPSGAIPAMPLNYSTTPVHPASGTAKGGGGSDSACTCWIQPDTSYILAMPPNDDGSSAAITLPFQFSFFDQTHNVVRINNNGNISFAGPYSAFSATGFPTAAAAMVAPFWADVDTRAAGQVWYRITPTALYVNWVGVGHYNMQTDKLNWFQVIITNGQDPVIGIGNNVGFCYLDMQWTTGSASNGIGGFGGVPATAGVNAGDGVLHAQIGRFNVDSNHFEGPYTGTPASGINWLDSSRFEFSVITDTVPPVFGTGLDCDTLFLQVGTENWFSIPVLAGGPGWTVSCSSEAPGLSGYVQQPVLPGDWATVDFAITATADEIGPHTIQFTAFYVDGPSAMTDYTVNVVVRDLSTWVTASADAEQMLIAPNPASDRVEVRFASFTLMDRILMHDAQGRSVMSVPVANGSSMVALDVAELEAGCYVLSAISRDRKLSERLVVAPR